MVDSAANSKIASLGIVGNIGVLMFGFAVLVMALSYAGFIPRPSPTEDPIPKTLPVSAEVTLKRSVDHDYTLLQLGKARSDQFLIDRKTGRIWQRICDGEVTLFECEGITIWHEMYVSELTPEDSSPAMTYRLVQQELQRQAEEAEKKKP